jgi:hypothetical protein
MAPLHASIWNSLAAHKLQYNNHENTHSQTINDPSNEGSLTDKKRDISNPSMRGLSKGKGKGKSGGLGETEKKPNPVWHFMVLWKRFYFLRFNVVYTDKKRDFSAVKILLNSSQKKPEELIKVAQDAWDKSGYGFWACENRTREICDFCSDWNKINTELYGKTNQRNNAGGGRPVADRNAGTLNDPRDYEGISKKL